MQAHLDITKEEASHIDSTKIKKKQAIAHITI